jgi:hypothetical protein
MPMIGIFFGVLGLIQIAWHVAVIVFVYKIWTKVRHLPDGVPQQ